MQDSKSPSSYMDFLPIFFQKAPQAKRPFIASYLKIFERIFSGIEDDSFLRGYLFSFDEVYASQLDQNEIPEDVRERFARYGHELSKNITIHAKPGKIWEIRDRNRKYYLLGEGGQISAYSENKKGIEEILAVAADFFHPRLGFLFPESESEFLPPLQGNAEKQLAGYISTDMEFHEWLTEYFNWMARWMALVLKGQWTIEKRREVIAKIMPIFRMRGTKKGLEEYLRIYVGAGVTITEENREFQVGVTSKVGGEVAIEGRPYFFIVHLALPQLDPKAMRKTINSVREIINVEKPAHTVYVLKVQTRTMQLEEHSTVGVDSILGG